MPVLPSDITVIVMLTTNGFNREPKICYPGFLLKLEAEQKGLGLFFLWFLTPLIKNPDIFQEHPLNLDLLTS